jgi:hypothetical protein
VCYNTSNRTNVLRKNTKERIKIINIYGESTKWKNRLSEDDLKVCVDCDKEHGHIYHLSVPDKVIKLKVWHPHCRCFVEKVKTILHGTATDKKQDGADFHLFCFKSLPEYYITIEEAVALGWRFGKDLSRVAPGVMITRGIYKNYNEHLPTGRTWYEADINYTSGKRNKQRILYSNDGLIFVTYDHYRRFYEIV